jgi:hypothetical protein
VKDPAKNKTLQAGQQVTATVDGLRFLEIFMLDVLEEQCLFTVVEF